MNINDVIHGFLPISRDRVEEISAYVNIFEHKKSGAKLCFIEREDRNLSFAISFATPPEDDTGVFHIIEHSVLCGSRKFPVKEPFVEMLKGSLNTFLNAMTYEDKTVYPVSSRCEKDFYNLVDVYLDAVFHPLMLTDERIFMQEGWHLEPCDDGVCYNGVVFSEMSGAYSSPDELAAAELSRSLFEGSIYGFDSGGRPDSIPDLTYEAFKAAHQKYYTPENSLIVLDGSIDLDKTLALIDSYLSEYERRGFSVETVCPEAVIPPRREVYFRAEDGDEKARLLYSSVVGGAADKISNTALTILCDVLLGTNESVMKKALLATGLCEDVSVYMNKAAVSTVTLEIHGIEAKDVPAIDESLVGIIKGIISDGIDKRALRATLDRLKFRLREKDLGAFPRGVANSLAVLEGWHYGISPTELLTAEDALAVLEGYIDGDYYEKLLLGASLDSKHRASIVMLPSGDGDAVSARIAERESELCGTLCEEELEKIAREQEALEMRQNTPDTEEAVASIPILELTDIKLSKRETVSEISDVYGARVLHNNIETNGILYTELYFSAQNLTDEELTLISIISSLLTNLDTERYTAWELKTEIKSRLGSFSPLALSYTRVADGGAIPLFAVKVSSLSERADDVVSLTEEILLRTKYDDKDRIKQILTQIRSATEDTVFSSGDGIATERVEGAVCDSGRVNEELLGLPAYRRIKEYENGFDECSDRLVAEISSLAERLFSRERLTLSVSGEAYEGFAEKLVELFPCRGELPEPEKITESAPRREGVRLPVHPAHTAFGSASAEVSRLLGYFKVAQTLLSYEYLWGKIRVLGGAYGAGMATRRYGGVIFSSYRDPSPKNSLEVFRGAADFLREFVKSGASLTKYIIGAVGEYDVLKSPRTETAQASADYLTGWTREDEQRLFEQMLSCDEKALYRVADLLDSIAELASFTVVGDAKLLADIEEIDIITP